MAPADTIDGERRRITFVEALGKGGFGAVYLADVRSRTNFDLRLAVKVLNEDLRDNEEVVRRQRDEARLLAQLNHDHIVKVFDLLEIDGRPAVLMEYVPGVDANRLIQNGPIPARAALEIAAATANALHAANVTVSPFTGRPLNVIHRDVKPSNLLISEYGTVKVLDFGIARADFDREGQTRSMAFGTARYMAPEQWLNDGITAAVDVFALGITMLELLSGRSAERLPLRADKFNAGRDAQISALRDPRWGGVWWRQLEELLQDMLSLDPIDRPSAARVQEVCLELSEDVGGMSLQRYSKARVPPLMASRRAKMKGESLLPSADLEMSAAQDPSLLTGGKSLVPTAPPALPPVMGVSWWLQLALACGLALSLWWFLSA
jgi:serine/threonine-protein kinase